MSKEDHITTLPKRGLKRIPYSIDLNERDLKKLSKSELIKMLLKQKKSKKVRNHEDLLKNDPFNPFMSAFSARVGHNHLNLSEHK